MFLWLDLLPIYSMYGIFTNICLKIHPNVGKYTIHGAYGLWSTLAFLRSRFSSRIVTRSLQDVAESDRFSIQNQTELDSWCKHSFSTIFRATASSRFLKGIIPIGSMVLVYMLTWLGYIDGIHGAPYIAAPWILWVSYQFISYSPDTCGIYGSYPIAIWESYGYHIIAYMDPMVIISYCSVLVFLPAQFFQSSFQDAVEEVLELGGLKDYTCTKPEDGWHRVVFCSDTVAISVGG